MLFSAENDEDDFTISTSSSTKLASLFGADSEGSSQHDNQSLVYRPPKQPLSAKKTASVPVVQGSNNTGQQTQRLSVIHSAVVHAYKFEEGIHVSNGNLGIAVVGNHDTHVYQLLLYRGKQEPIATTNITSEFAYTVQSNNYASFYDNKRKSWSILFSSEQAAIECAKQVGLARANSCLPSLQSVLSQDVVFGKGPKVNATDTVAVKYTRLSVVNYAFGSVVDETKTFIRMALGSNETLKVLNEGLVGMSRGGTRFLFVPQSLVEQTANLDITSVMGIIFIVQVAEELSAAIPTAVGDNVMSSSKLPSSPTHTDETTVRARGASISEQLQLNPKTDKAKIISRMAKMGQATLPVQGAVSAASATKARSTEASSESDEDTVRAAGGTCHSSPSPEPVIPPKPRVRNQIANSKRASLGIQQQQQQQQQQTQMELAYGMATRSQILPMPTAGVNPYMILPSQPYVGSPGDAHVPVLLSEMRSQTTELRLQMGHMSEKVDQVLGKLEHVSQRPSYPTMEADVLTHNIQRIVKENEEMRAELKDRNQKLENQTLMINELLQRNQKFLEQSSSMWEQRNAYLESSSMNDRLKSTLEQDLQRTRSEQARLEAELAFSREQLEKSKVPDKPKVVLDEKSVQSDPIGPSDEEMGLKSVLAEAKQELVSSRARSAELQVERDALLMAVEDLKRKCEAQQVDFNELKPKYEDLVKKLEAVPSDKPRHLSTSTIKLSEEIKKIMNAVNRNLNRHFSAGETYSGQDIKEILASTIRAITLELMDHFAKEESASSDGEVESKHEEIEAVNTEQKSQSTESEARTDDKDWRPQPPPFSEGESEEEQQDWFS